MPNNLGKSPGPVAVIESDSDTDDLVEVKKNVDIAYYLGQVIYIFFLYLLLFCSCTSKLEIPRPHISDKIVNFGPPNPLIQRLVSSITVGEMPRTSAELCLFLECFKF